MTVPFVRPLEEGRLQETVLVLYEQEVDWTAALGRWPLQRLQKPRRPRPGTVGQFEYILARGDPELLQCFMVGGEGVPKDVERERLPLHRLPLGSRDRQEAGAPKLDHVLPLSAARRVGEEQLVLASPSAPGGWGFLREQARFCQERGAPAGVPPWAQLIEEADLYEVLQGVLADSAPAIEVGERRERLLRPLSEDGGERLPGEAFCVLQPPPEGGPVSFHREAIAREVDVRREYYDPLPPRLVQEGARAVEAHRLGV